MRLDERRMIAILLHVRCGNLTAVTRQRNPRVYFGGAVWSEVESLPPDCPAKGQPLQSAFGGFSLGGCFVVVSESLTGKPSREAKRDVDNLARSDSTTKHLQ